MVNTLDFGGVRTAVFREARTECIRDFCHKGHKQGCRKIASDFNIRCLKIPVKYLKISRFQS